MSAETADLGLEDLFERVIKYPWDLEALVRFGSGTSSLLESIDVVIGRYLLHGWADPLVDALTRSQHVPDPPILRIIGNMHEFDSEQSHERMHPYAFVTVNRVTQRTIQLDEQCGSCEDDASMRESLAGGDVRPLAKLFQSGRHPGWPVLAHYAEMHTELGNTPFVFRVKRRDGRKGRRIDPQMEILQFLAAGSTEWRKHFGDMTHEMACLESASLRGEGDHEEWSRKASRIFGRYFRARLSAD